MSLKIMPYRRRANYYETDRMGIVHHSNYIRWMEEARLDYMRQTGTDYADMERDGILIPVVDVSCQYKSSIFYDELFSVETKLTHFDGVRLGYSYRILKEDGTVSATGASMHCFLDDKRRVPFSLRKGQPELYNRFMQLLCEVQNADKESL